MTSTEKSTNHILAEHILGFQHVGHIVTDLAGSIADFKRLYGLTDAEILVLPPFEQTENVQARFALFKVKDMEFELIEPISDYFKSLLFTPGASGSAGINHVAWRVKDIDGAMTLLAANGIKPGHVTPDGVITMTKTSTSAKKMVYLDPATTGGLLVELIEVIEDDSKSE
ncbi:VOC family protein [Shewanella sp. A25]|nr:VOC family protein [Shewanella shenzhenensis]